MTVFAVCFRARQALLQECHLCLETDRAKFLASTYVMIYSSYLLSNS